MLAAHFVAVTTWIEGRGGLPAVAPDLRLANHLGIGGLACVDMIVCLAASRAFSRREACPAPVSAALIFPRLCISSCPLVISAQVAHGHGCHHLGFGLAPLLYLAFPGFDLLATGLIGGNARLSVGPIIPMSFMQMALGGFILTLLVAAFSPTSAGAGWCRCQSSRLDLSGQPLPLGARGWHWRWLPVSVSRMVLFPRRCAGQRATRDPARRLCGRVALYFLARGRTSLWGSSRRSAIDGGALGWT